MYGAATYGAAMYGAANYNGFSLPETPRGMSILQRVS